LTVGTRSERNRRGMPGFNFDLFGAMTICGLGLCSLQETTGSIADA
jgi:hypothetical protein